MRIIKLKKKNFDRQFRLLSPECKHLSDINIHLNITTNNSCVWKDIFTLFLLQVTLCDPDPQALHTRLDTLHSFSDATVRQEGSVSQTCSSSPDSPPPLLKSHITSFEQQTVYQFYKLICFQHKKDDWQTAMKLFQQNLLLFMQSKNQRARRRNDKLFLL